MELRSYSKIFHLGHRILEPIGGVSVVIEEKVDGSQFSFGVINGELHMRSKRVAIHGVEDAQALFRPTVEHVIDCHRQGLLPEGWTFRGEAFCGPKHNTLAYGRAPIGNLVLFDVDRGMEDYVYPEERRAIADGLGVEAVRVMTMVYMTEVNETVLNSLLASESQLGGALVEGVVIKPTQCICGPDGKRLIAKFVSEAFKETHIKNYRPDTANKRDIITQIGESVATPARWNKSVQRLREEGKIEGSPRDIGPLIAEIKRDVIDESEDEIKAMLWDAYRKDVIRASTAGFPEWYKRELAFGGAR